ncbi:importin-beta N-terminal domain-containing protein [Cryptosporidium serpentis]
MNIPELLDVTKPYDLQKVQMLDELVGVMYGTRLGDRVLADKILSELRQKTESWRIVGNVLQLSRDYNTKFFGLSILEKCIQYQWKILPNEQKVGIKQYITELCIELCQDENVLNENKYFLNKTNETLIMIVKQEWPDNWESFIGDICNAARTNQYICENTMKLLRLLSEEVFDFGEDQMISKKVSHLMTILNQQFPQIFSLILFVLVSYIENPQNLRSSLVLSSLECLCHYLKWIPLNYILECDLRPQLGINISNDNVKYNLLQLLLDHFWGNSSYRLETIRCLTEIANLNWDDNNTSNVDKVKCMDDQMIRIWLSIVNHIKEVPKEYVEYETRRDITTTIKLYYEKYYKNIALLLSSFIKTHRVRICEKLPDTIQALDFALDHMVNISYIQNDEIFKICSDFWLHFAKQLVFEILDIFKSRNEYSANNLDQNFDNPINQPLLLLKDSTNINDKVQSTTNSPFDNPEEYSPRLVHYQGLLCSIRKMIICRMAKPQEVYIAIDAETGEVSRENIPDTDEISLYKILREILIYLSNLGQQYMEKIILDTLQEEFDVVCIHCGISCVCNSPTGSQWNPIKLNRLCWAVGSISGSLNKNTERRLIIEVIKSLLMLCERKRGKANKAAVASCVMYIVGQYPSFLKDHWKFLQTVVNKLFEFMHETFPGVKDMACEAFLKICMKCKKSMSINNFIDNIVGSSSFISVSSSGPESTEFRFLKYMINYTQELMQHLNEKQMLILINGISLCISLLKDINEQYLYITELLKVFDNVYWNDIMVKLTNLKQANFENQEVIESFCSFEVSQRVITIVRIMEMIASSSGIGFSRVLTERSHSIMDIYNIYSSYILKEIQLKGISIIAYTNVKQLRNSKKEIIKLVNSYITCISLKKNKDIKHCETIDINHCKDLNMVKYSNITGTEVCHYVIRPLIIPILEEYMNCGIYSDAREAQVLNLAANVVMRLSEIIESNIDLFNSIIFYIFECTLSMIKDNFHTYPDHREYFYQFLANCNEFCFVQLLSLPTNILTLYIESIIWAIRHEQPNMAEKGLTILNKLIGNLIQSSHNGEEKVFNDFCHGFYRSLNREVLSVLTDTLHTSGFHYQTLILHQLVKIVEFSLISNNGNSNNCATCGGTCLLSKVAIMEYMVDLLLKSFITVQKEQVEAFVLELFNSVHSNTIAEFQTLVRDFLIQLKEFSSIDCKAIYQMEKNMAIQRAMEIEKSKKWMVPGLSKTFKTQEVSLSDMEMHERAYTDDNDD